MVGNGYTTGTADPGFYQNKLKSLINDPSSFSGTPGYQFALDQGLKAVNASNSTMRGSGNALTALLNYGQGAASQNYGDYLTKLGGLAGQEQGYDVNLAQANNAAQGNANTLALGNAQNANNATRNANDLTLGLGANANTANRNANDLTLGNAQNANTAQRNSNDFGLGMYTAGNNFSLGQQQNANTAQNNWWNYSLGNQRNNNDYSLGAYNAQTNRGTAQSNAFNQGQNNQIDWTRLGYQLNPGMRYPQIPGMGNVGGGWQGIT